MRFLRIVAATGLLVSFAARARPAEGLYLRWGDCPLSASASVVRGFSCDTDAGDQALICAFTSAQAIDSVLGVEIVVDLQHSDAALPDWWHLEPAGCRDNALRADQSFSSSACSDVWGGQAAGGILDYAIGMPRGESNQARITLGFSVPSNQPRTVNAVDMYYAARLVISNMGTSVCGGCLGAACLVLNSIRVLRPPRPLGAPSADVLLTEAGTSNGNWAGWQTLASGSCQLVPVRNATWGQIKSLYR
jgi:hypothetical protein